MTERSREQIRAADEARLQEHLVWKKAHPKELRRPYRYSRDAQPDEGDDDEDAAYDARLGDGDRFVDPNGWENNSPDDRERTMRGEM